MRARRLGPFALLAGCLPAACLVPSGPLADVLTEEAKHTAADAAEDQFFGRGVAIRDDLVVVGADGDRQRRGAAYVYRVDDSGWTELAKLTDPTAMAGDGLGESVCFPRSGEVALSAWSDAVGRQYASGTVQLYSQAAGWARSELLIPPAAAPDPGGFGRGLACAEGRLLVGAEYSDGTFAHEGLVTFFRHASGAWRYDGWFEPVVPRYQGYLGLSVAIDGNLAAAAAPGRAPDHLTFYRRTAAGWEIESDVGDVPSVTAMALSGDLLVAGAPIDDGLRAGSGVVIVYRRGVGGWVEQTRLLPEQAEPYNRFGDRLAFDGELLAIGELYGDVAGPNHGAVHLFFRDGDGWRRGDVLAASDGFPSQGFGRSIAIDEQRIVVGAVLDDERAHRAGAVYEFERPDGVLEIGIDLWPSRPGITLHLPVPPRLPVALLGSADFDPAHVDRDTLAFGPSGAPALSSWTLRDVNDDGYMDGVGWFTKAGSGIAPGDTEVCLTGETDDGTPFEGCTEVLVVFGCGQGVDLAAALPLMVVLGRGALRWRRRRPDRTES
jgi:hypothetical protein